MSRSTLDPVWLDPDFAELLAEDPELVAIADAVRLTGAARPVRRRPTWLLRLGAVAAVVVAVLAIVLAAPWNRGSQAAVLEKIRSALTPRPGWILHERDVTRQIEAANGRPVAIVSESWTRYAPPYTFREVVRRPGSAPVEEGGALRSGQAFVFDPATKTLYRDNALIRGVARVQRDQAAELRRAIAAGKAAVAGRITIDGRTLLRIVPTTPQRYGFWVDYVDGTTFRPVRFELSGLPVRGKDGIPHPSTSVTTVTAYDYLPPTAHNLRLADIRARHPATRVAPAPAMPARLREEVTP